MTTYTGAWSAAEAWEFLEGIAVPVRLACRTPDGHLWMLSLWYAPREEELRCATAADADVVGYLEANDEVAFEVSTNRPPYRGVRGRGTATIEPDSGKALLRDLIERYLGDTDGPLARTLLDAGREEVRLRISPERVHTWDYGGRMETRGEGPPRPRDGSGN